MKYFQELREGYKSPAEAQAIADGKKAARQGKKYADNPHKKGSKEFTAWSKGHNMARESVEVCQETLEENFAVHKNGKPLMIKGKAVTAKSKESAQKAIDTMMKQPFNKNAKFTIVGDEKKVPAGAVKPKTASDKEWERAQIRRKQNSRPAWRYAERGESVEEAKRPDSGASNYFSSYSGAISSALAQAKKKGFEVDEDDVFREITTGQGKPSKGKTVRHTLKLTKGGKAQKKALHIQVYNRGTSGNTFELNSYIS